MIDQRLASLIPRIIRSVLADEVYTALPGKIERILDAKKRKISVKPLIKKIYLDNQEFPLPIIENVPLIIPGTDKFCIKIPFAIGDRVLIIFSQRSLDTWLSNDVDSLPGDNRKFSISDGIAIGGLNAFSEDIPLLDNNTDFGLQKEKSKIIIEEDETIILENEKGSLILNGTTGQVNINNGNLTVDA